MFNTALNIKVTSYNFGKIYIVNLEKRTWAYKYVNNIRPRSETISFPSATCSFPSAAPIELARRNTIYTNWGCWCDEREKRDIPTSWKTKLKKSSNTYHA